MADFKQGQTCFTETGVEAVYVARCEDGTHIVSPLVRVDTYDGEYDERPGDPIAVGRLYNEPPQWKYDEAIKALQQECGELRKARTELRHEVHESERQHKERLEKLKSYEALRRIEDFIDGRMTHVVIEDYGDRRYKVAPIEELQTYTESWTRKPEGIRLISLFGKSNGQLDWAINQYRDDSGTWKTIRPCTSEEEAEQAKLDLIADDLAHAWAEYQKNNKLAGKFHRVGLAAEFAGVPMTEEQHRVLQEFRKRAAEAEMKRIEEERARLEERAAKAKEKLEQAS